MADRKTDKATNNSLIGFNDQGEKITEENLPWYRDADGKIIFKKQTETSRDKVNDP